MFHRIGNWFFNQIHGRRLVYASCWEDPQIDREALQIGPCDRLVVITSAGCNVLDYLLEAPSSIAAVDVNFRQNALLDLKLAALAELDWPDLFQWFGRGFHPRAREIYQGVLRPQLNERHQRFWDHHLPLFRGPQSFYFRVPSGWFARMFQVYAHRVAGIRVPLRELLQANSLPEQREIYEREIRSRLWRPSLRFGLNRSSLLALSGIPPEQCQQIAASHPDLLGYLQRRAEYLIYHIPLRQNYFWHNYLFGNYRVSCCPRYLMQEHQATLAERRHRISLHENTVALFLQNAPTTYSRFVLLDHMDWLTGRRLTELRSEWEAILSRAVPGSRAIWRSLGLHTDFVDDLELPAGSGRKLGDRLHYHDEWAEELQRRERVNIYGCLKIADLNLP